MRLTQTEQDILSLFVFYSLLVFLTGSLASLLVKIFQPFLLRKVNRMKGLDSKHFH